MLPPGAAAGAQKRRHASSVSSFLVGLSQLNLNKYANVRDAKLKADYAYSLKNSVSGAARSVNEHGELEVKKYKVLQRILSDAEIIEIAEAYLHGKTTYQLAEQYGCCRRAIVNALKKNSITATKAKAQEALDKDDVIKMYSEFHTTAEIAKKYGVDPNSVIRCLRSSGVAIRSRWDYPRG